MRAEPLAELRPPETDEALFLAHKGGDPHAFSELFERYRGPLTTYAWRMVQRLELAEEITVEAFCKVLDGSWSPGGSLRAFLYTVVHRLCIDRLRRRKSRRRFAPWLRESVAHFDTPERAALANQNKAALERAISRLPEAHRAVLLLYYNQELSSREVAQVIGCDDQQVRSKLSYARRLLRRELDGEVTP